jgi:hypothetical protein
MARTKTHASILVFLLSRPIPCSGASVCPPSFTEAEASKFAREEVLRYLASRGDLDWEMVEAGAKAGRREGVMVVDKLRVWRTERRSSVDRIDICLSAWTKHYSQRLSGVLTLATNYKSTRGYEKDKSVSKITDSLLTPSKRTDC